MRRRSLAVGVSLTFALASGAAQQAPAPAPAITPVFRSGISYIELDASVLDRNRNPVRGLTAGDFTVLEDGQPQKILSFSEINVSDPEPPPVAWMRDVTPDVQANDEAMNGRLVIMLLDDNQAPKDRAEANRTKEVARMLVDRLGAADRAVVLLTRLPGSQEFTNDHTKLLAAINAFRPFQAAEAGDSHVLLTSIDRLQGMVTSLSALPGKRKALFYFGVGVRMPHPERDPDAIITYNALIQLFRDARKANVNIYPIDPSGLGGLAEFDASRSGPAAGSQTMTDATEFYQTVAENTGGLAIVDRNDFATVVPRILRENGSYYLLGYESPNLKLDGKLRTISVKVNQPDVTIRARSGYYGAKADVPGKPAAAPGALSSALETTATSLVQSPGIRMQVSTAAFAVIEKPGAALAITLGVRPEPLADTSQMDDVDFLAEAFTDSGAKAALWRQPFRIGTGVKQYELLTRLDLKPGRYQLRVSTESKLRGKTGSVFADLEVPDFSKALSLSGVVIHAEPALTAPPADAVSALVPIMPTTLREFAGDQQVTMFLKVYQGGNGKLAAVPLSVRIRDVHNRVVFEAPQTLAADRFGAIRAAEYRLTLPMDKLAPGPYLLTIEGTLKKDAVRRDVRFQVHANATTTLNAPSSAATSSRANAQPGVNDVLARVAAYLTAYADQYSSTIATERYVQTYGGVGNRGYVDRTLIADFGIVRLPGNTPWLGFRDVTRVDGKPIADREGRLAKLFQGSSVDALKQASAITEESTRFNLGSVQRTINNPAIVLDALDARNQGRFIFSKIGEETQDGTRVWVLRFTEPGRPTFVTTFNGEDEPLVGRAWVDPMSGRPSRVELAISARSEARGGGVGFLITINVTFQEDERLRLWVPATMTERYTMGAREFASGSAKYTDYRRFGVETKEELAK
jgi:VWFA-related protein